MERRTRRVNRDRLVVGKRARGRQQETFLTYLGKVKHKLLTELLQRLFIHMLDIRPHLQLDLGFNKCIFTLLTFGL